MGFTPAQVDKMSLWEFMACADGVSKANGHKKSATGGDDVSDEKLRSMGVEGF